MALPQLRDDQLEAIGGQKVTYETQVTENPLTSTNAADAIDELTERIGSGGGATVQEVLDALRFGQSFPVVAGTTALVVENQTDFNGLSTALNALITATPNTVGNEVKVLFGGGLYKFNNANKITITASQNKPNVKLTFKNKNSEKPYFIADGAEYTPANATNETGTHYICPISNTYTNASGFVNQDYRKVDLIDTGWLDPKGVHTALSQVTLDSGTTWKFLLPPELDFIKNKTATYFQHMFLMLDVWWDNTLVSIDHTDNDYLYFTPLAAPLGSGLTYNSDFTGKNTFGFPGTKFAEFRIVNLKSDTQSFENNVYISGNQIYIPKSISKLYECNYYRFIDVIDAYFNAVSVCNLNIVGTNLFVSTAQMTADGIDRERCFNVNFYNARTNVNILNCVFNNVYQCFNVYSGRTFITTVRDCTFKDIYGGTIKFSSVSNHFVDNNRFENTNLIVKGADCIYVTNVTSTYSNGATGYINNNTFIDFAGAGINTYQLSPNYTQNIKNNILYHTQEYQKNKWRNTLFDLGAIYVIVDIPDAATHNIIGNIVCNYKDKIDRAYAGIYLDNGAGDCFVKNNLVWDCSHAAFNSYYQTSFAGRKKNVYLGFNFFGSPVRHETAAGYTGADVCTSESNVISATTMVGHAPRMSSYKEYSNIIEIQPDIIIGNFSFEDLHVWGLPSDFYIEDEFVRNFAHNIIDKSIPSDEFARVGFAGGWTRADSCVLDKNLKVFIPIGIKPGDITATYTFYNELVNAGLSNITATVTTGSNAGTPFPPLIEMNPPTMQGADFSFGVKTNLGGIMSILARSNGYIVFSFAQQFSPVTDITINFHLTGNDDEVFIQKKTLKNAVLNNALTVGRVPIYLPTGELQMIDLSVLL